MSQPKTKTTFMSSKSYTLASAIMAFVLWGGWAYFVNEQSLPSSGFAAGLTQGLASGLMTLIMVRAISVLIRNLPVNSIAVILPAFIIVTISSTGLILLHTLSGTPNILSTIAPVISVAFGFCVVTTIKLRSEAANIN